MRCDACRCVWIRVKGYLFTINSMRRKGKERCAFYLLKSHLFFLFLFFCVECLYSLTARWRWRARNGVSNQMHGNLSIFINKTVMISLYMGININKRCMGLTWKAAWQSTLSKLWLKQKIIYNTHIASHIALLTVNDTKRGKILYIIAAGWERTHHSSLLLLVGRWTNICTRV